ncbi:preprotein translocase subunit SecG [candidate division KSB1 bacterium]
MLGFITFIHIIVSVLLIVVILMQSSKGGGLAGITGGDMMGAVFGGRGAATFLTRITTILAIVFALTCLTQVFITKGRTAAQQSLIQEELGGTSTSPAAGLPGLPVETVNPPGAITAPPDTSG